MTGATAALTALPPWLVLFALAVAVTLLPRRAGTALAAAGSLSVAGWLALVPSGTHLPVELFGFDAALFAVVPFSRLFGVALAGILAAAVLYGHARGVDRRHTAIALAYAGAGLGVGLAGDWLTLVVFWELMAAMATLLVWHAGSRAPGLRYAVYHELGALALLGGVALHYAEAGTFLFGAAAAPAGLAGWLVVAGVALNAAVIGLHVWVPDIYPRVGVAASVVLAAVTTKAGAYTLVRAVPDGNLVVAYAGGVTVIVAVTLAVLQTEMRRLLSYHIVSQVGYMVAGVGAGTALARSGAAVHLVSNVLYKTLLFMVAGVLVVRAGTESLKKLGTSARDVPRLAAVFAVAALAISGVPGFNGFVSKGMVFDGVEASGLDPLWWLLVVGSVGTVVSFVKFGYYAFGGGGHGSPVRDGGSRDHDPDTTADLSTLETAVMGAVAAACLVLGLFPGIAFGAFPEAAVAAAKPFSVSQFTKAGAVLAAGLVLFALVRRPLKRVGAVPDLEAIYEPAGRWLAGRAVDASVLFDRGVDATGRTGVAGVGRAVAGLRENDGVAIGPGALAVVAVLVLAVVAVLAFLALG